MFHRDRPEKQYAPLYGKYHIGTITWSSLAGGLLTGKYNDGIPDGSHFATHSDFFTATVKQLQLPEAQLTKLAKEELQTTVGVLALAWVAKDPNTSTVILGASKPEQIAENLKA
ncbi:Aldo/keto reductase, partial [Agrocybe pediades]